MQKYGDCAGGDNNGTEGNEGIEDGWYVGCECIVTRWSLDCHSWSFGGH
mgnify:CR=1 FL=1